MAAQRHVEIAGGGFTGLTIGTALAQAGWSVRVHERSSEIRAFGAGIWIWDNGVRVLKAIGAADEALDGCTDVPSYISWDANGRFIDEVPFAPVTSTDQSRMFCITRQQLLSAMLHAAERAGVEIITSSTAVAARPDGTLITEDRQEWPADLAIAADGINSKVRDSLDLLKSRKPHVDGAIRVLVPHEPGYADTEEGRTIREWWNGYRRVLYTPCNRDVFYLCFTMLAKDAEAAQIPLPREVWIKAFPHLESMISRVPDEGRYDRFETTKLKTWSAGRVAIVGDSAHSMSPGLGQGCGTAINNALSLANMLGESPNIEQVLQRWEKRQRPLSEHTQLWSTITWPLTLWPHWAARIYYNMPLVHGWMLKQRRKPSEFYAYGTENQVRWMPPHLRSEAAAE
jgi:2-polyprenyl-6-methoxyphenol hydroxylase-like FAD-dependent oxidoreductase